MVAWRILPYSSSAFCRLLAEASKNTPETIERKLHAVYFDEYFSKVKAKTIVAEFKYVDHDFLEDFAAYYVRCFHEYPRECLRLHFFGAPLDDSEFADLFLPEPKVAQKLQESYLGFVVVRPLPDRVIGRTCLKTYPLEDGREFPVTRTYESHLFGLQLTVESIAFQEQDRAVAACATSALWSVFHGTGVVFHHRIPSPVEITRSATTNVALDSRALPATDGLTLTQMADAVRACELEPIVLTYTEPFFFKAAVHAYAAAHIPVLINGDVLRADDVTNALAVHAVCVTGYCKAATAAPESDGFQLAASRITKLYCHDDGVGPFARMEFLKSEPEATRALLTTSLAGSNNEIGSRVFRPDAILVPVYHKIRVPFIRIYKEVRAFDNYLGWLRAEAQSPDSIPELEWDIRLITVNEYKSQCIGDSRLRRRRREILEAPMPKFIWQAHGTEPTGASLDLLFDATGLELSQLCFACVERGSDVLRLVRLLLDRLPAEYATYPDCTGVLQQIPIDVVVGPNE